MLNVSIEKAEHPHWRVWLFHDYTDVSYLVISLRNIIHFHDTEETQLQLVSLCFSVWPQHNLSIFLSLPKRCDVVGKVYSLKKKR